ncbi:MAG: TlpA family protein disulfide reductase [Chloroflexi bacterium]|nr:TlpA family protein disulfide reductase [Chloroflexota bacterium]
MTEAPPEPARRPIAGYAILAAVILFAIAGSVYLFAFADSDDDGGDGGSNRPADTGVLVPERPEVGKLAPDFALVDVRDGKTVRKLSDYRGKVVVINWFASWCDPCRREIPAFLAAEAALGDQIVFLGIDYDETRSKAAGFLAGLGAGYPALLDEGSVVAEHYRVSGLPATFFVDKDGVLRAIAAGEVTPVRLEEGLAKVGLTYKAP